MFSIQQQPGSTEYQRKKSLAPNRRQSIILSPVHSWVKFSHHKVHRTSKNTSSHWELNKRRHNSHIQTAIPSRTAEVGRMYPLWTWDLTPEAERVPQWAWAMQHLNTFFKAVSAKTILPLQTSLEISVVQTKNELRLNQQESILLPSLTAAREHASMSSTSLRLQLLNQLLRRFLFPMSLIKRKSRSLKSLSNRRNLSSLSRNRKLHQRRNWGLWPRLKYWSKLLIKRTIYS